MARFVDAYIQVGASEKEPKVKHHHHHSKSSSNGTEESCDFESMSKKKPSDLCRTWTPACRREHFLLFAFGSSKSMSPKVKVLYHDTVLFASDLACDCDDVANDPACLACHSHSWLCCFDRFIA